MPLIDTYGWKFKMDVPFMNQAETAMYRRLREAGALGPFKFAICSATGCENEIPQGKKYCSRKCMDDAEAEEREGALAEAQQEDEDEDA